MCRNRLPNRCTKLITPSVICKLYLSVHKYPGTTVDLQFPTLVVVGRSQLLLSIFFLVAYSVTNLRF